MENTCGNEWLMLAVSKPMPRKSLVYKFVEDDSEKHKKKIETQAPTWQLNSLSGIDCETCEFLDFECGPQVDLNLKPLTSFIIPIS